MFYLRTHINTIVELYDGAVPLSIYTKNYLSKHKQLGARDRKMINDAVYGYYRLAKFYPFLSIEKVIALGIQNEIISHPLLKKVFAEEIIALQEYKSNNIDIQLSEGLTYEDFFKHLTQLPNLFIRSMIINEDAFIDKINEVDIPFEVYKLSNVKGKIIALPNATPLQKVYKDKEYIIQDLSSQKTIDIAISKINNDLKNFVPSQIWDVCSGAGGKTILLKNIYPNVPIIATDIRESVLANLKNRIRQYKIKNTVALPMDMSIEGYIPTELTKSNLIVCDVPCSGSGTWGRTPEQFHFFSNSKLEYYTALQRKIMTRVIDTATVNSYIIYITCSVFYDENESQIAYLQENNTPRIIGMELVNGLNQKSDTLFLCVMQKI